MCLSLVLVAAFTLSFPRRNGYVRQRSQGAAEDQLFGNQGGEPRGQLVGDELGEQVPPARWASTCGGGPMRPLVSSRLWGGSGEVCGIAIFLIPQERQIGFVEDHAGRL
jgi:hypothetical protein